SMSGTRGPAGALRPRQENRHPAFCQDAGAQVLREIPSIRKRERREHATELGIVGKRLVGAYRTEPVGVLGQPRGHADTGPAADPGEHGDILLAAVLIGHDVADDPRRSLEAIELLAVRG